MNDEFKHNNGAAVLKLWLVLNSHQVEVSVSARPVFKGIRVR
jgi:hypothetical protein